MKTLKNITLAFIGSLVLISCDKNKFTPSINDQQFSVEENSPAGTLIGLVEAYDQDECQKLTFEIIDGNDEGTFKIDAASVLLSVNNPGNLDYESHTQIALTISVSDGHDKRPLESTAIVTINIINVLEASHFELVIQPDEISGKDAPFSKIVPDNNYGNLEDIMLLAWTQSGTLNVNRVAIDFDLSEIPPEATIDSAVLSLYFNNTSGYGTQHEGETDFLIQRIISDWNESTVTWNTQPSTSLSNQVSVDGAILPHQDFPEIDVTSLIQDYSDNRESSYGLLFRLAVEEPYKILLLASSENQNSNLRPKLKVDYTTYE